MEGRKEARKKQCASSHSRRSLIRYRGETLGNVESDKKKKGENDLQPYADVDLLSSTSSTSTAGSRSIAPLLHPLDWTCLDLTTTQPKQTRRDLFFPFERSTDSPRPQRESSLPANKVRLPFLPFLPFLPSYNRFQSLNKLATFCPLP